MLDHPKVARLTCGECAAFMRDANWDLEIGRDGKPIPRLNVPTPCSSCPRGSPEREAETTITTKNLKAYRFALEMRATNSVLLTGTMAQGRPIAPVTLSILRIVDGIVRDSETQRVAEACSMGAATLVSSLFKK